MLICYLLTGLLDVLVKDRIWSNEKKYVIVLSGSLAEYLNYVTFVICCQLQSKRSVISMCIDNENEKDNWSESSVTQKNVVSKSSYALLAICYIWLTSKKHCCQFRFRTVCSKEYGSKSSVSFSSPENMGGEAH